MYSFQGREEYLGALVGVCMILIGVFYPFFKFLIDIFKLVKEYKKLKNH